MRVVMLYRPNSEHAGAVEAFANDYRSQYPKNNLELISLDTRPGADMATLYGLTQYPALMALADDGSLLRLWQDSHLPIISELSPYAS